MFYSYNSVYQSKIEGKKKGSGLAIYLKNGLEYSTFEQFNQCTKNLESLFVSIKKFSEELTVGVIYRPPSGSLTSFLSEYEELLQNLPNKNVIITGDFNLDLHKPNNQYENIFYGNGFVPTISIPTHEKSGCNETCIDNIFTNSWNKLLYSGVLKAKVSDHFPIFCMLNLSHRSSNCGNNTPRYDTCESNMNNFMEKFSIQYNCQNILSNSMNNEEHAFNGFVSSLSSLVDECFMVTNKMKASRRNRLVNPWITSGIIASVNTKNFLYDKWKKTVTKSNKAGDGSLYIKYKDFRRKLKSIIRIAKKSFYYRKFDNCKGDTKKTWSLINELRGKSKQQTKPSFIIDGQLVRDRRIIANQFNKYFTSIAKNMNDDMDRNISGSAIPSFGTFMDKTVEGSIYLSKCDITEICDIIRELNSNKSSDLPITVIKNSSFLIAPFL